MEHKSGPGAVKRRPASRALSDAGGAAAASARRRPPRRCGGRLARRTGRVLERAEGQLAGREIDLGQLDPQPVAEREHRARPLAAQRMPRRDRGENTPRRGARSAPGPRPSSRRAARTARTAAPRSRWRQSCCRPRSPSGSRGSGRVAARSASIARRSRRDSSAPSSAQSSPPAIASSPPSPSFSAADQGAVHHAGRHSAGSAR